MMEAAPPARQADLAALGQEMARQRRAYGWTQTQLAARLAEQVGRDRTYSQTTISQWEKGNAEIPTEVRSALTALFGDLDQALSRVGRPQPAPVSDTGIRYAPATDPAVQSDNFDLWRACVGLPDSFPMLRPPSRPFLNQDRERQLRKLVDFTASPDGPSVILTFAAGHGITTYARHALKMVLNGDIRSAVIPVPVSLADKMERDGINNFVGIVDQEELAERVRRRIVGALALKPRESARHVEWLGPVRRDAQRFHELLHAPQDETWLSTFGLDRSVGELPLDDLVAIARGHGLYISLFVDVSSTPELAMNAELRRVIEPLFEGLAAIQLEVRDRTGSTFSVVAFAPREDELLLRQALVSADGGLANPEVIEIRPYAPFEVYRMLMDEYGEDLPAKLASDVLLGIVDEGIPLRRTESLLLESLHEQFSDLSRTAYALGPSSSRRGARGV